MNAYDAVVAILSARLREAQTALRAAKQLAFAPVSPFNFEGPLLALDCEGGFFTRARGRLLGPLSPLRRFYDGAHDTLARAATCVT